MRTKQRTMLDMRTTHRLPNTIQRPNNRQHQPRRLPTRPPLPTINTHPPSRRPSQLQTSTRHMQHQKIQQTTNVTHRNNNKKMDQITGTKVPTTTNPNRHKSNHQKQEKTLQQKQKTNFAPHTTRINKGEGGKNHQGLYHLSCPGMAGVSPPEEQHPLARSIV